MISYFHLPEVSTSDLKALERTFYARPDPFGGDRSAIEFGSLVDALLEDACRALHGLPFTGRVDYTWMSIRDEATGVVTHFTKQLWEKAIRMADLFVKDPVIKPLIRISMPQYVFRRTLTFDFDGTEYELRGRCMFDLYAKSQGIGLDYKQLAISTQKQLIESLDWFDYDMQAAFYMDLARIDYHWIAAGSKPKEKIFKYAIERDSVIYNRGREKWTRWAYYWIILVGNLNLPTNEIHTIS